MHTRTLNTTVTDLFSKTSVARTQSHRHTLDTPPNPPLPPMQQTSFLFTPCYHVSVIAYNSSIFVVGNGFSSHGSRMHTLLQQTVNTCASIFPCLHTPTHAGGHSTRTFVVALAIDSHPEQRCREIFLHPGTELGCRSADWSPHDAVAVPPG